MEKYRTAECILQIEKICFERPYTLEMIKAELQNSNSIILLAGDTGEIFSSEECNDDAEIAAYCLATLILSEKTAELLRIAVMPGYQKRGMASRLILALEKVIISMGIRNILLEVSEKNMPAIHLYETAGFTFLGIRTSYYPDGSNAMLYRKKLNDDRDT